MYVYICKLHAVVSGTLVDTISSMSKSPSSEPYTRLEQATTRRGDDATPKVEEGGSADGTHLSAPSETIILGEVSILTGVPVPEYSEYSHQGQSCTFSPCVLKDPVAPVSPLFDLRVL
jgi:hypothetical protein